MATTRTIVLGVAVGVIFAAYLAFWLHVVAFLAVAAGASALVLILLLAAAFGEDAEDADAAWREATAAHGAAVAGRTAGEPTRYEPATWFQPEPRADPASAEDGKR
jgi:hypothetical protein